MACLGGLLEDAVLSAIDCQPPVEIVMADDWSTQIPPAQPWLGWMALGFPKPPHDIGKSMTALQVATGDICIVAREFDTLSSYAAAGVQTNIKGD